MLVYVYVSGITRCTTLYTEMHVDTTLIHQEPNLDFFIGTDRGCVDPTVIQLGGSNLEDMRQAVELVELQLP